MKYATLVTHRGIEEIMQSATVNALSRLRQRDLEKPVRVKKTGNKKALHQKKKNRVI